MAVIAITALGAPALAQNAGTGDGAANKLDEIVVTGSRSNATLAEVPSSITVVSSKDVQGQLSSNNDIRELLTKLVPGIGSNPEYQNFSSGNRGPQLRGRSATVLLNGVQLNSLLFNDFIDLSLADPNSIDRIEVKRGASALFGFGASGGIISAETRRGTSDTLQVTGAASVSANTKGDLDDSLESRGYVGVGQKLASGFSFYVGGGIGRSRGKLDAHGDRSFANDDTSYVLDTKLGYDFGDKSSIEFSGYYFRRNVNTSRGSAGYFLTSIDDNGNYVIPGGNFSFGEILDDPTPQSKKFYDQSLVLTLGIKSVQVLGGELNIFSFFNRNKTVFGQFESEFGPASAPIYTFIRTTPTNRRFGFRSDFSRDWKIDDHTNVGFTAGIDYINDQLSRNFYTGPNFLGVNPATGQANPFKTQTVDFPGFGPVTYDYDGLAPPLSPPVRNVGIGGFFQGRATLGDLKLQAGIRREHYQPRSLGYDAGGYVYQDGDLASFNATLFNAGFVFSVRPSIQLYGGVSQGLDITELGRLLFQLRNSLRINQIALSDVSGRPAKTTEYELGVRGQTGATAFSLVGFYSRSPLSSNLKVISPSLPPIPIREPTRVWGVEGTLDHHFTRALAGGLVAAWQDGKRKPEGATGFQPQNNRVIAPPRATAYASYDHERWSARVQATYSGTRKKLPETGIQFFSSQEGNVREDFVTVDAVLGFKVGPGALSLGVDNLFNKFYTPVDVQASNEGFQYYYGEGRRVSLSYRFVL